MNENVKDIAEGMYLHVDYLRRTSLSDTVFIELPVDNQVINCDQWEDVEMGDEVILRNGQRELIHGVYSGFINSFMHPHFYSVEIKGATKD